MRDVKRCGECGQWKYVQVDDESQMATAAAPSGNAAGDGSFQPLDGRICPSCGQKVRKCIPRGGDGSVDVWVRHRKKDGTPCENSRMTVEDSPIDGDQAAAPGTEHDQNQKGD